MYTVVSQRWYSHSRETIWSFLTNPHLLAKWFADASELSLGSAFRFDFGDGDFFCGRVVEWQPEISLGLAWKFVGLGPEYEVRYSLLPRKNGTELSVQDRGALVLDEAECLRVGWTEFLLRLEKVLRQGGASRFDWRKQISFTARIGQRQLDLIQTLSDPDWYRESFGGVRARVRANGEDVVVEATKAGWGSSTTEIRATQRYIAGERFLFVLHEGWNSLPSELAESDRRLFLNYWLNASTSLGLS